MDGSRYISLAYNFWTLVRNSISEMEKQKNQHLVTSDYNEIETESEIWGRYYQKTNWNDNNIGVPILFNFYHGLKLYLKGLLEVAELEYEDRNHKLKSLFEIIKNNEVIFTPEIIGLLKKHIYQVNEYNPFFKENNIDVNMFYLAFKYPESINGEEKYFFGDIRGKGKKTLLINSEIKQATIDFYNAIVKWQNKDGDFEQYLLK